MHKLRIIGLLGIISLLFFTCRKPTVANWDVDAVLPVVNSQLNIKNFVGDSIFKADNTGLLSLSLSRELTSFTLDSLIPIPDTSLVVTFTVIVGLQTIKQPPGTVFTFFPSTELNFNVPDGVAIKRMDVRTGRLKIKFSNSLSQPIDLTYVIPSATKNGFPFTIIETVPNGSNSLSKSYDLSGFSFNMSGISGNSSNSFVQSYTMAINPNADTVLVGNGEVAKLEVTYENIVPQYVQGYFGQLVNEIPLDTTKLNLINNFYAPNFALKDARLDFKIVNEFGVEFRANLSNIKSINSISNKVVAINTNQLANINLNRATKSGTTVYPSTYPVSFTSANSNIVPFLSNLPDKITRSGKLSVNPLGNISGYNDFAFYGQGVRLIADINIPLRFNADYFKLTSTSSIDLQNAEQLENVKDGNFVILAKNGYPFKARLQAYLKDAQGNIIDSLFVFGKNTIEAGQIDGFNKVVAQTSSKVLVPIDQNKITKLRNSKSIQVITYFIMPPNPPDITIYENYTFDINIVAELNYNVQRR
jgi:hypothetical protein